MDHENMASPHRALVKREARSYDVQVGIKYGPLATIVYSRIRYWVANNWKKGTNIDENGIAWTYDSAQEMAKKILMLSVQQVQRALQDLKAAGLIISKPDPDPWKRRLWYSLPPSEWLQPCDIDVSSTMSRHIKSDTSTYQIRYVNKDTSRDISERLHENTNTRLASLVSAPTSSSHLCQSEGVSSIGDGDAEPECSPRPIRRDSRGGQPSFGIKTPPPTRPPLKTRENGRPVDPPKYLPGWPLIFISLEQHEKLQAKHTAPLMSGVYEWYSGWKESKMEADPKMLPKATDYWRLTNWVIKAYKDRQETDSRFSSPKRKGHIHADEVAMKEMKARTAGLSEEAAMIVEGKMSLEECLRTYRVHGSPNLDEIREVFPEYTGDGS